MTVYVVSSKSGVGKPCLIQQPARTKSTDHHQSSKALVAAVSEIAIYVTKNLGVTIDANPQRRCIWTHDGKMHVTSRNLDGAVPALHNPYAVWEIKEYWGVTSGGSKMSDAVYECQLVGRELRDFEKLTGLRVMHYVFLDGRAQWTARRSDFQRFLDLESQGLIDRLFVGNEVETDWGNILQSVLDEFISLGETMPND